MFLHDIIRLEKKKLILHNKNKEHITLKYLAR
jgi:hypothetical protein